MELTLSHIPRDQALRYLGYGGREVPDNIQAMVDRALAELFPLCRPRYVWRVFDLKSPGEAVLRDSGLAFPGGDVPTLLRDCGQCVLMAVTLGDAPEALIRRIVREETGGSSRLESLLQTLIEVTREGKVIQVNERELGRVTSRAQANAMRTSGKVVLGY